MLFGIYATISLRDFGKSSFKFGLYLLEVRNSAIFRVVSYSGTMRALFLSLFLGSVPKQALSDRALI